MGHVKKRTYPTGRVAWRARYEDPDSPRRREIEREFRTKNEAQRWLHDQVAAVNRGEHIHPASGDRPFAELAAAWQETWADLRPNTRAGYESILDTHVLPTWGRRRVARITPTAVQAWVNELAGEGMAPGTIRNVVAVFRAAWAAAVKLGLAHTNPATGVRLPKSPHREELYLTAAQVFDLADAVGEHWRPLVLTAAYTGLRAGELAGLRRRDVDVLRGTVRVERAVQEVGGHLIAGPPKTARSRRTVALPRFLVGVLNEHLRGGPDDAVFVTPSGAPLRHNLFYRRVFKPAVRRALPPDLAGLRFHDLRHTAVALAIETGAHPKAIADRMGHSTIAITMDRYGHLFPGGADAALAAALDARAPSPSPPRTSGASAPRR